MKVTLGLAAKILSLFLFEEVSSDRVQALLESRLLADLRDVNIATIDRDSFRRHVGLKLLNPPFLAEIGTITIPAITERFIARDKFVLNFGPRAKPGARISLFNGDFEDWFLGKTEEPTAEITLRYVRFTRSELDGPIVAELGARKETTLAQIYWLMERQPNGEKGVLLTNRYANVFYVPDISGTLRAVYVHWGGLGWRVYAHSLPTWWHVGIQVFSRNSPVAVTV